MHTRSFVFAMLLVVATAPTTESAHAQSTTAPRKSKPKSLAETLTGQAQRDLMDGLALLKADDAQGALLKFKLAYEASKEPRILYNISSCYQTLKQYVKARATLQKFREDAEAAGLLDDKRRAETDIFLSTFARLIGKITIHTNVTGATVLVDDVEIGTTPLRSPIELEQGSHRARVTKPGFREWSATVDVQGDGQETVAEAKLEPIRHEGRLIVTATPKDATIRIDGTTTGLGIVDRSLPSGPHHVVVSAKGSRTREFDAVITDDQTRRFDVTLDAEPSSHVWVWLGAGAVLVTGVLVTSIVIANQRDNETTPDGQKGTVSLPLWGAF